MTRTFFFVLVGEGGGDWHQLGSSMGIIRGCVVEDGSFG